MACPAMGRGCGHRGDAAGGTRSNLAAPGGLAEAWVDRPEREAWGREAMTRPSAAPTRWPARRRTSARSTESGAAPGGVRVVRAEPTNPALGRSERTRPLSRTELLKKLDQRS